MYDLFARPRHPYTRGLLKSIPRLGAAKAGRARLTEIPGMVPSLREPIAGCPFVPSGGNGPCATASFVTSATRVLAGGTPVLLQDSVSVCVPTGTPTIATVVQTRVIGS